MRKAPLRYVLGSSLVCLVAVGVTAVPSPVQADTVTGPRPPDPGTSVGKPGQTSAPAPNVRDAELLRKQDRLLPVARELAEQARAAGSDIGGVSLDVAAGTVHLYRTDVSRRLELKARVAPGDRVTVHRAKFNRGQMTQAADRITRDAKLLGEQRISVQAVGPNVDGSGVTVTVLMRDGVTVNREQSEAGLRARYGDIVATVRGDERQTSDKDLFFGGWRFNDYAPWYGGDRIYNGSTGSSCTGGFAAWLGSSRVMLTAAHCGSSGDYFYNGPTATGGYNFIGTMVYDNDATDVGAISVTSMTDWINVGPAEPASGQIYVGSWASPIVGEFLCQSGSFTGEVCDLYVVDTAQSVCVSWFLWWCTGWQGPLADVVNWWGPNSYSAGYGDSGAPVYLRTGGGGVAKGLVHGVLTPNAQAAYPAWAPVSLWCPSPEGWSVRCSAGFSFAHMPGY